MWATPAARALITSPDITVAERQAVLDKLCAGRTELLRNLIGVLQERRRLEVLFDLYPAYRALVMAARGEVEGIVESAHPIDAGELAALTTLAGRLSGMKVRLSVAERADLLGGVRLRIGNVLYDGSLRAALEQLEQKLQQAAI
jgi:F-type H+-transporting ATPase subunit delta